MPELLERKTFRMKNSKIKYCVFDAFGTLFKLNLPTDEVESIAGDQTGELMRIWRTKQLEYTWLRALMNTYIPFSEITKQALQLAMAETRVNDERLFDVLMPIYLSPDTFPTVGPMLQALKTAGIKTAILSNGTRAMLQAGVHNTQLNDYINELISVDEIKTYKPNPEVYALACEKLNLQPQEFYFVSSNRWDICGAGAFGLQTIWVNQYRQQQEVLDPKPDVTISSLAELPNLISN